jgi:hypothetical protein
MSELPYSPIPQKSDRKFDIYLEKEIDIPPRGSKKNVSMRRDS